LENFQQFSFYILITMQTDMERLRRENELLREGGAYGGAGTSHQSRSQQISRELRLAAVTAENNLRFDRFFSMKIRL
jgi:hypothetical protein